MLSAVTIQPEFTRFIGFWSTSHNEKQPCSCLEPWRGKAGLSLAADPSLCTSVSQRCEVAVDTLEDDYALRDCAC